MQKAVLIVFLAFALLGLVYLSSVRGRGSLLESQTEFKGKLPPLKPVTYITKDGSNLTLDFAYEGLVTLLARGTTAEGIVRDAVAAQGGKVVDAIPRAGIYTIQVPSGSEAAFITALFKQGYVIDAAPSTPFTTAVITTIDYFNGTGRCEPHGENVAAVAARGGHPVKKVEANTPEFQDALTPLPGLTVVGNWPQVLARSVIKEMEASAEAGERNTIVLSSQSIASKVGDARGEARRLCGNPATAGALECRVIQQEQLSFFEPLFQAVENADPKVRDNTAIFIAAGNAGVGLTEQIEKLRAWYPAAAKSIKIAGATDAAGNVDRGMNFASSGMVFARGVDVTTLPGESCSGTSFANPEEARILDEMWRANPSLTSSQVQAAFDAALASCPGAASSRNIVPQSPGGTTPQNFIDCATEMAAKATPAPTKTAAPTPRPTPTLTGTLPPARDLTGDWAGTATIQSNCANPNCIWPNTATHVNMHLVQTGNRVTGTVTTNFPTVRPRLNPRLTCPSGQVTTQILNGVVSSSRLTFTDRGGNSWSLSFTGNTMGGTISNRAAGCNNIQSNNVALSRR